MILTFFKVFRQKKIMDNNLRAIYSPNCKAQKRRPHLGGQHREEEEGGRNVREGVTFDTYFKYCTLYTVQCTIPVESMTHIRKWL